MSRLVTLRHSADYLYEQGKPYEAFIVYDEARKLIWTALSTAQTGIQDFSQNYLTGNVRNSIDFKSRFFEPVLHSVFQRSFDLDPDDLLNEFTFITFGRLQCICDAQVLPHEHTFQSIASEFLVLYTLILHGITGEWIGEVLKIVSPGMENQNLKRFRLMMTDATLKVRLVQQSEKVRTTDWAFVNGMIVDYLNRTEEKNSVFYRSLLKNVIPSAERGKKRPGQRKGHQDQSYRTYEKYERYEWYEKYEKYEQKEKTPANSVFDFSSLTESEKTVYCGKLFNLQGQVSKSAIRKKYIEAISLYHPDKVAELGSELKDLAEKKTKEFNIAYEWLKQKYKL